MCRDNTSSMTDYTEQQQQQRLRALDLPATVAAQRRSVGLSEAAATTATATPTATASATTPAATAAAAAVADHLSETGVDLLLGLSENSDQITSLLRICRNEESDIDAENHEGEYILSVVKNVMAVPLAPARPVRPIRWT